MPSIRSGLVGVIACAAGACASSNTAEPSPEAASPNPSPATSSSTSQLAWSGSLQPMQERTGYAAPTKQHKTYGTVRLEPTARDLNRTKVSIVVSTSLQEPASLTWAVLPGRCGSPTMPMVGYEHFPVIEVGTNGRGQLNAELPMALPYDGSFHVNIYGSGQSQPGTARLENVLTCANLRRGGS
jgi:hypothetical protein